MNKSVHIGGANVAADHSIFIQNDIGNLHSATTIVAMITGKSKNKLPTHVSLYGNNLGLTNESIILLEQIQTLDKMRFIRKLGHLDDEMMKRIDQAAACSMGLNNEKEK